MTQHTIEVSTVLVYLIHGQLSPSLLGELESTYDRLIFHLNGSEPSSQDLLDADVIFGLTIPKDLKSIDQVPRLKLFQAVSAGFSHITSTEFWKAIPEENEVMFANASGIHVSTIGEHCLATVLMLYHKLHTLAVMMHNEQRWVKTDELGGNFIRELSTLTVGIIGYGHIGRETVRLFKACNSKILALNRNGQPSSESGYILPSTGDPSGSIPAQYYSTSSRSSLLSFFSACDVVINTLPDSEHTRKFVGREELKAMKGDAVYVNIGRGTTTDQEALVEALEAKRGEGEKEDDTGTLRIGGASLDVTDPEPLPDNHPLYTLPNVVLTPHMSGSSKLYFERASDLLRLNVERVRSGRGVLNAFRGKGEDD
ncbi:uncharacterized protein JCM6883_003546 [Sporobolomyces salmoneus]|uniref:uncharacterized protein n=1 Tax=Sporobolomyces salmoneus TaxID=183962 RepID=UPI00317A93D4